ncbi:MAG: FUSC family protein [Psychrobacter sp.]|nr:FUSC family protein [Psychrobacter sp.]
MIFTIIKQRLSHELSALTSINASDRPWHLPLLAALTIALPICFGVSMGQLDWGIQASLGAMIILNIPNPNGLSHQNRAYKNIASIWPRQAMLLGCALMMSASFGAGLLAQHLTKLQLPVFFGVTLSLILLGRYLRLPPPAGLFMMMAGAIALFMPVPIAIIPSKIGTIALGSAFAWIMALGYHALLIWPPYTARRHLYSSPALEESDAYYASALKQQVGYEPALISESLIVASFVTLSLAVALGLNLSHPYWVPVSCFIIMQGMHLRTMWVKQLHRLLGTLVGTVVAGLLLSLALPGWGVAAAIFMMILWIETIIVRHYGLAVVIITPLTIFIAEYGHPHSQSHSELAAATMTSIAAPIASHQGLLQARLFDTALGCCLALLGGVVMHSQLIQRLLVALESKVVKGLSGSSSD